MGLWTVPTKVMLAGEYGVLAPGGSALALATAPLLRVAAVPTPGVTVLRMAAAPGAPVRALLPEEMAVNPAAAPPEDRLPAALWSVALEGGASPEPMVIDLRWDEDPDGWDPVGTSAAVAVGLALVLTSGDREAALRLAWTGHARAQGGGSGYDVAACLTGGAVRFHAGSEPLSGDLETGAWPRVEAVQLPRGLRVVEASTGHRAPTRDLLARLEAARADDPQGIAAALAAHRDTSASLAEALVDDSGASLQGAAEAAAVTLDRLDALLGHVILTEEIRTLVDVARRAGVPARVSGAGGGDGVVGFARSEWLASRLRMRWIQAGFAARGLEPAPGALEVP